MDLPQKTAMLREYENYCYRIAYYLLQTENWAIIATKKALLELAQSSYIWSEAAEQRQVLIRRIATKHALACSICRLQTGAKSTV
jgi:hypothetical protein